LFNNLLTAGCARNYSILLLVLTLSACTNAKHHQELSPFQESLLLNTINVTPLKNYFVNVLVGDSSTSDSNAKLPVRRGFIYDPKNGLIVTALGDLAASKQFYIHWKRDLLSTHLIGSDAQSGITLVQIDPELTKELPSINYANTNSTDIVHIVFNADNIFTVSRRVMGIICAIKDSSCNRAFQTIIVEKKESLINYGALVVNDDSQPVGILTKAFDVEKGNMPSYYEILPFSEISYVTGQMIVNKGIVHPYYSGMFLQNLNSELADAFKIKNAQGALVANTVPQSPADTAGIHKGDIIISVNNEHVINRTHLVRLLQKQYDSDTLQLTLIRAGKTDPLTVTVKRRFATETDNQLKTETVEKLFPRHSNVSGK